MPLHHNAHYLIIQMQELECLDQEVRSHPFRKFGWNRRIELIFIYADHFFLSHILNLENL